MSDIDRELLGIVAGVILVFAALFGVMYFMSYRPVAAVTDLTDGYIMPPELTGCRVYQIMPKGHGRALYVVANGEVPMATSWDAQSGKSRYRLEVVTP